eukprot:403342972
MGAIAYFGYCLHRVNSNEYQMASIDGYKGNVFDYTHNLTGHFDPAFMVQYAGTNMDVYANMDTYFTMYVQQLFQSTDPMTGAVSMTLEYEYNMMKCNLERFGSDLYEEAYSYGLANYWCMNGTELYINGGSRLFSVFFDYCNQTFLDRMYPGQGKHLCTVQSYKIINFQDMLLLKSTVIMISIQLNLIYNLDMILTIVNLALTSPMDCL